MSKSPEHDSQVGFFRALPLFVVSEHERAMIYAIPNGGHRNVLVARRLKAEGVKAGVWDIAVDLPRRKFHGLRIEMKAKGRKLTPEQVAYRERYEWFGYQTAVCYSTNEAIESLMNYLNQ